MLQQFLAGTAVHGSMLKTAPSTAAIAALLLTVVICKVTEKVYVEFSDAEDMGNVIAAMQWAEKTSRVCFDPLDEDLWEVVPGGYRLHGMFTEEIAGALSMVPVQREEAVA